MPGANGSWVMRTPSARYRFMSPEAITADRLELLKLSSAHRSNPWQLRALLLQRISGSTRVTRHGEKTLPKSVEPPPESEIVVWRELSRQESSTAVYIRFIIDLLIVIYHDRPTQLDGTLYHHTSKLHLSEIQVLMMVLQNFATKLFIVRNLFIGIIVN